MWPFDKITDPFAFKPNNQEETVNEPNAARYPVSTAPPPPVARIPQDIHEDLYYRVKSMEVQAEAEYNQRMALAKIDNVNYDPQLAGTAGAIYQGDVARIHGYRSEIQAKWKTVDNADQFDNDQKKALKYKVLNSVNEPVYIPQMKQAPSKEQQALQTIRALGGGEAGPLSIKGNRTQQPVPSQAAKGEVKPAKVEEPKGIAEPKTIEDYDAIPRGNLYRDTDGKLKRKK